MARHGRISRIVVAAATEPGVPQGVHGQIHRIVVTGAAISADDNPRHGRIHGIKMVPASLFVTPITPTLVPSQSEVVLSLQANNSTLGVWTCRQISGSAVQIEQAGSRVSFVAPATIEGDEVVLGVKVLRNGLESPELEVVIPVRPHQVWQMGDQGELKPIRIDLGIQN